MANVPTFINKGTFASGTTSIAPGVPASITNEDMLVMIVHTPNQAVTTPAGWTEVANSPQSTGTANAIGGVRLTVFWKPVAGIETAPTVAITGGTASAGIIFAFRGVDLQNPFDVTAGRVDAAATTAMSWQAVTATVANTLILMASALDQDIAGTAQVGNVTAAGLTSITERHDPTVTTGVGGGVHMATGIKATAGATGTMTATGAASTTHAYLTMALQGAEPEVRTVGQYANDMATPIAVGGSTNDGIGNNIYLQAEYDSGAREMATTPKAEIDPVATAFNGTPNSTLRSMTQTHSITTRNLRGSTLVYDNHNKRYIQFGGYDGTTRFNEVWERYVDKPGNLGERLSPTGTAPTGRNLHGAVFVKGNLTSGGAVRAYMLVWGGADPNDKNDMLALRLDTPGSEAWTTITQTSAPTVRSYLNGHMAVAPGTDSSNQYVYMFGGWAATRENNLVRCTFDVDTPTAVTWTTLKANGAGGNPSGRTGVVMDYKESTNMLYMYGGYTGATMLNEFWEYNLGTNTWVNTTPTGTAPTASECGSGGYDATNNRFWFTGGWTTNGTFSTSLNQIGYISNVGGTEAYNVVRANTAIDNNQTYAGNSFAGFCVDTDKGHLVLKSMATVDSNERYGYIIDFNEGVTSEFPVYGEVEGEYFNARDAMASVINPTTGEWLNIGGFDDMSDDATIVTGTHSGDIWTYNQSNNTWRYANKGFKSLPALEGRVAAWDTTRDRCIVFGGLSGVTEVSNEVWELIRDANGNYEAKPLRPTGTKPAPRWLGACAYDATLDRVIFALGGDGSGPINDVWELSFTGSAQGAWTQRTPSGSVTAATGVGFAHKASNRRLYIFGGATNSALSTVVGNFYYLDMSTTNCAWNTVTQTGQTNRRTPAMAYDATNDRIVVMGGFNGTNVINTTSYYNLASGTAWANAASSFMPDARRSLIGEFIAGKFYITGGRPNTGTWYRNTLELTPNYGTPNSSTWVNKIPHAYTPVYHTFTGGTNGVSYHWQAWTTEGAVDSAKVSHGNNLESAADFTIGSGGPATITKTHTTDTLKKRQLIAAHTTSANRKKAFTIAHTTSSFLRRQLTVSHTTSANKKKAVTTSHTTSAVKRKATTISHSTDALKAFPSYTKTHTADALKTLGTTIVSPVFDASSIGKNTARTTSWDWNHTTANQTNRLLVVILTLDPLDTGSSVTYNGVSLTYLTGGTTTGAANNITHEIWYLLSPPVGTYSIAANISGSGTVTNGGAAASYYNVSALDGSNYGGSQFNTSPSISTTTSEPGAMTIGTIGNVADGRNTPAGGWNERVDDGTASSGAGRGLWIADQVFADAGSRNLSATVASRNWITWSSWKGIVTVAAREFRTSHTADAYKYVAAPNFTRTHTTSAVKRKENTISHTTSANKKAALTRTHTTSANKRAALTAQHTTNALKRRQYTATHTTNALKAARNTISHTTNANKRKAVTQSHTTDSYLRLSTDYSRTSNGTLPTDATNLATAFTPTDYTNVSTDNSVYVDQTGTGYLLFQFKKEHTNSIDGINVAWNGKSTKATTATTAYMQIWNYNSSTWESIASNNTTAANTDFTMNGSQQTNLSNYYNANNVVVVRIYQ